MGETLVKTAEEIKGNRVGIDALIQAVRVSGNTTAPLTLDSELYNLAETRVLESLIEAKMWYGKMLEALGLPFPANLADNAPAIPGTGAITSETGGQAQ